MLLPFAALMLIIDNHGAGASLTARKVGFGHGKLCLVVGSQKLSFSVYSVGRVFWCHGIEKVFILVGFMLLLLFAHQTTRLITFASPDCTPLLAYLLYLVHLFWHLALQECICVQVLLPRRLLSSPCNAASPACVFQSGTSCQQERADCERMCQPSVAATEASTSPNSPCPAFKAEQGQGQVHPPFIPPSAAVEARPLRQGPASQTTGAPGCVLDQGVQDRFAADHDFEHNASVQRSDAVDAGNRDELSADDDYDSTWQQIGVEEEKSVRNSLSADDDHDAAAQVQQQQQQQQQKGGVASLSFLQDFQGATSRYIKLFTIGT